MYIYINPSKTNILNGDVTPTNYQKNAIHVLLILIYSYTHLDYEITAMKFFAYINRQYAALFVLWLLTILYKFTSMIAVTHNAPN